ncbi:DNA polymerase IV [Thalassobaculum fulvum]|uniref:DNA polymerase IV n=1 Tax=Thalassobaculum fulvum TaxID=1633335 RepID=A0A918XRH0_9PROT|nr:DNA polymerase IV [Thalassobaculum fulvum]GHD49518.1 DNA polymerase IV [Thalassobaculum fulvum]
MTVPAGSGAPTLCRDCFAWARSRAPVERCPRCGSRRLAAHPELDRLSIAHLDCDAFYASVEKRDDPSLLDRPVIVGGGKRGVVSAACYVARVYGVRSAMPMFKALDACPHAVVIKPNMEKYAAAGAEVRALMREVTPLVEPLSIDEAFLDLSGTERLHGGPPAETLARLTRRIEESVGVTASIGLSYNKFLAKVASDLDKPRGFFVIGEAEVEQFLAERPVSIIWGVGRALHRTLLADGIRTVGDLQRLDERDLMRRYGSIGQRLARFSHGRDSRRVEPGSVIKSVSSETTFDTDIGAVDALRPYLWRLSEEVSGRLKRKAIAGHVVTLKLKTADFRLHTRQRRLSSPTQLADRIYRTADDLLAGEADGRKFRLIGVGVSELSGEAFADPPDLAEPALDRRRRVEAAIDAVRAKLGSEAIVKGRGLRAGTLKQTPSERGRPDDDPT